jgi:hypothetical protein
MLEPLNLDAWLVGRGGERRAREAVNRWLDHVKPDAGAEQRAAPRTPYFGSVTISLAGEEVPRFSAFARDLSPLGIGLLHIMPLEPGQMVVSLRNAAGETLSLRTQIVWCEPAGDGWYTSGGRFLDVFPVKSRE